MILKWMRLVDRVLYVIHILGYSEYKFDWYWIHELAIANTILYWLSCKNTDENNAGGCVKCQVPIYKVSFVYRCAPELASSRQCLWSKVTSDLYEMPKRFQSGHGSAPVRYSPQISATQTLNLIKCLNMDCQN